MSCNNKHFEDLLVWQCCNWFSWLIHNLWSLQIEHECSRWVNKNHFDFQMTDHILYEQHLQQYVCTVQKFPENRITNYNYSYHDKSPLQLKFFYYDTQIAFYNAVSLSYNYNWPFFCSKKHCFIVFYQK